MWTTSAMPASPETCRRRLCRPCAFASPPTVQELSGVAGIDEDGLGVDLWELHEVLRGRHVGEHGLALIEAAGARLDERYAQVSPQVMLPEVATQLRRLIALLTEPQPVRHR